MRVVVYVSEDGPPGHQAVCHVFHADGTAHPVMIFGVTPERARERAETWLAAELERAKPKEPRRRKAAPAPEADEIEEVI